MTEAYEATPKAHQLHNADMLHIDPTETSGIIRVDASHHDRTAIAELTRRGVRVGNEDVDADTYLFDLITKPWGQEYRAYADDYVDVWHLELHPGQSTSMHAHPRKTTYLMCLSGAGFTQTLNGSVLLRPGVILRIGRGAFHATMADPEGGPLMLIEVETPRNKFDLLRLRDNYARAGTGYEREKRDIGTKLHTFNELPRAKFYRRSPCQTVSFGVHTGMEVFYRRHGLGDFLVPVGAAGLTDDLPILSSSAKHASAPDRQAYYLGITSHAAPDLH